VGTQARRFNSDAQFVPIYLLLDLQRMGPRLFGADRAQPAQPGHKGSSDLLGGPGFLGLLALGVELRTVWLAGALLAPSVLCCTILQALYKRSAASSER